MPRKTTKPALVHHKPSGQARVRINGKDHYLGRYGSQRAFDAYDELIREWLVGQDVDRLALQVDDLCLLYVDYVREHYRKGGEETSEVHCIQLALRHLVKVHGETRIRDFSPKKLKAVRDSMIASGYVRSSINLHVGRIKRMFRWGVSEELVPVEVYQSLCTVSGLRKGRTRAKESEPVRPVPESVLEATLPHLTSIVQTMVRLQLLTGMRPGEVCAMRPCDVTLTTDGVWVYRPKGHKTEHHDKERRVYIGPQAQELLRPFLNREPEAYCFSPAESELERNAKRRSNRKSPMTPSQAARKPTGRRLNSRFTKDSYNRSIRRACETAFGMPHELRDIGRSVARLPEHQREEERQRLKQQASEWRKKHCWSPNQLRHNRATFLRERYGLEAARVVLGQSDTAVTAIYAERDFATAARIMSEVG